MEFNGPSLMPTRKPEINGACLKTADFIIQTAWPGFALEKQGNFLSQPGKDFLLSLIRAEGPSVNGIL